MNGKPRSAVVIALLFALAAPVSSQVNTPSPVLGGSVTINATTACPTPSNIITTSAGCIVVPLYGGGATIQLQNSSLSATVNYEVTFNGYDTTPVWGAALVFIGGAQNTAGNTIYSSSSATQTANFLIDSGVTHIRLRCSSFTSGSTVVVARASPVMPPAFNYAGTSMQSSGGALPIYFTTVATAVNTSAPSYVNSTAAPLSQTTSGSLRIDLNSIIGTTAVTGGAGGSLSIGGTTGNRAAIVQNPVLTAVEARSTAPTAATDGQQIRTAADLAGNVAEKPPLAWSCNLANIAATLTQCQAAPSAGYSLYVTSWIASSSTTTAGTYAVEYGTGSNCGTGGTGVFPQPGTASPTHTMPTPTSTAPPVVINMGPVGFKLPAANALCAIGVVTNTLDFVASGYIAP